MVVEAVRKAGRLEIEISVKCDVIDGTTLRVLPSDWRRETVADGRQYTGASWVRIGGTVADLT